MRWWFKDAVAASRCLASGLMLPNVCTMEREHGPVQLDVIDREHTKCSQQTGEVHDGQSLKELERIIWRHENKPVLCRHYRRRSKLSKRSE